MKLVCGVGVNDAGYQVEHKSYAVGEDGKVVRKLLHRCPFYERWKDLLDRCYSGRHDAYKDCYVHSDWFLFSNFKLWMEKQDWRGKQLDKDIILKGNKLYSPETCAFVSKTANMFVTARDAARGLYPIGVSFDNTRHQYLARCRHPLEKSQKNLGYFNTPEEAHEAWRKRKHEYAQLVAELETDHRVVEALKKRYSVEEWYGNKT